MSRCGAIEESCICVLEGEHVAHKCECGGSWSVDAEGNFHIHAWPGSEPGWQGITSAELFGVEPSELPVEPVP